MSISIDKSLINYITNNKLKYDNYFNDIISNIIKTYKQYNIYISRENLLDNLRNSVIKVLKEHEDLIYSDNPKLVVIMGSAGSGKSTIYKKNIKLYQSFINHDLDEWRKNTIYYKIMYKKLKKSRQLHLLSNNYGIITQNETALIGDLLRDYALNQGISLIFQTGSPNPWIVNNLIPTFINSGFDYEIDIMTTNPILSKYFVYSRFHRKVKLYNSLP